MGHTADATPDGKHYESIAEAADRLGVSTKTIRRYIAAGRIQGYRFGPRFVRLNPVEVDGALRPIPSAAA